MLFSLFSLTLKLINSNGLQQMDSRNKVLLIIGCLLCILFL